VDTEVPSDTAHIDWAGMVTDFAIASELNGYELYSMVRTRTPLIGLFLFYLAIVYLAMGMVRWCIRERRIKKDFRAKTVDEEAQAALLTKLEERLRKEPDNQETSVESRISQLETSVSHVPQLEQSI
jgi:hypothetical protein